MFSQKVQLGSACNIKEAQLDDQHSLFWPGLGAYYKDRHNESFNPNYALSDKKRHAENDAEP